MVTIAHITERIIEQRPFLQECLRRGIVNRYALAEHLQPEVEAELKQKVKAPAIMMALRRFSEKVEEKEHSFGTYKQLDLTVKSDIVEITLMNGFKADLLSRLYQLVDPQKGDLLTVTQGLHETTILTTAKKKDALLKVIKKEHILKVLDDLSLISIRFPEEYLETPGYIYTITRALAWHDVNIVEVVSTLNELGIIIQDKDTPLAYRVLKELCRG
ncbi:hypothetical protein HYW21_00325 [Candidatus Woesearchaeota archaeon]|nr:hypothetical protein [Candidatus Woesearchaeota archaeon]